MRAIVVMFDSLNRKLLPMYGSNEVQAPNFERLAAQSATFDNCYAGSMPCMPARRELHTGRYNFLHRSWGPLEPFDDSMPAILKANGIATHLATDHMHYWEDGGATYHTRYGTFSLIRGQQGDPWKGRVADPAVGEDLRVNRSGTWRQDRINREYFRGLGDHPQTLTFDAGLEFIADNRDQQNWFVQIETFDPHEPFFSDPQFSDLYPSSPDAIEYDWPEYMQVIDDDATSDLVRNRYKALVTMCDASLGRVLDAMDEHELWDDTMLIVCTDHGFLLGEHGWWGKSVPPWYDETIHTPFLVWDPRTDVRGERRQSLVQTIDIAPTLLDFFGIGRPDDMQGHPLQQTVAQDTPVRDYGLFGAFGGHVSVTDGHYVYMRACVNSTNKPLLEHTLMPTHMRGYFSAEELRDAELVPGFSFTKEMPVLRTNGAVATNPFTFGTQLFDLHNDPDQLHPLIDEDLELRMANALVAAMRDNEAPASQFDRLGLPTVGAVETHHLLCEEQMPQVRRATQPAPGPEVYPSAEISVHSPIKELLLHDSAAAVLKRHCGEFTAGPFARICEDMSAYRAAALMIGVLPWDVLDRISDELLALNVSH